MVDWKDVANRKREEIDRLRVQQQSTENHRREAKPRLLAAVHGLFDQIVQEIEDQHNKIVSTSDHRISIDRKDTSLLCVKDAPPSGTLDVKYIEPAEPDRGGELHVKAAGFDAYRNRPSEDAKRFSIWCNPDSMVTGKQVSGQGSAEVLLTVDKIAERILKTFVWYIS